MDISFEPVIPIAKPKSLTPHILISYTKEVMTLRRFLKKGSKIRMEETNSFSMPQFTGTDHTDRGLNVIEFINKEKGEVIACTRHQFFRYNIKTESTIQKPHEHNFGIICQVKTWGDFIIYFHEDSSVKFLHKKGTHISYRTSEPFRGDYCGGYHAYSRGAEVVGDYLIFIACKNNLILYDLKKTLRIEENPKGKVVDFLGGKDVHESDSLYMKTVTGTTLVTREAETFFVKDNKIFYGNQEGGIYEILESINSNPRPNAQKKKIAEFDRQLTCINYFHGNVVACSFQVSAQTAKIHLHNLKTKMQSELPVKVQKKPTHKVDMFVKQKMCFGIALNRGMDMHVFGIFWCRLFMFSESVQVAAEYISGMIFLDQETVLVYGAENYNKKFKIKM